MDMDGLKFKVELGKQYDRLGEFITVELACGDEHASLVLPADVWRSFSAALAGAIADADDSTER